MFSNIFGHPLGFRHWVSWKLRQLAYRIHHSEPIEQDIKVYGLDGGLILELGVVTSAFDGGLFTAHYADRRYLVTDGSGFMFETPDGKGTCGFIRISGEPSS